METKHERGGKILVVDDEPNIRKLLAGVLGDEGYSCVDAVDVASARERLADAEFDAVLLDVNLPGEDGLELLKDSDLELPPVLMMSGHGNVETALEAIRLGAYDFLEKPLAVERLLLSLDNCMERGRLRAENQRLRSATSRDEILGQSAAMLTLQDEIQRVAPTDARVLITGENGTGKELVARALHAASRRGRKPFIKVNCAAIPSELLESELFGHERGAFTGAIRTRRGKFELAQGGTLLLDEIGDMNPTTQAKLLRVLEERELERVGGERTIDLDVRVISATNQDVEALCETGGFRTDLLYRLRVVPIHVPALRDHADDVELLCRHYLEHFAAENGRAAPDLSAEAMEQLVAYAWPGNIRELRNLMERIVIMFGGLGVGRTELSKLIGGASERVDTKQLAPALEALERQMIQEALQRSDGNVAEAARELGLERANLHRKMKRLGFGRA